MDGQLSIFDWMEDLEPKEAPPAAGSQEEELEVGQWVLTRGAPISRVMLEGYIGKKVLMDKSTSSRKCYKVGILEEEVEGTYWDGEKYSPCVIAIVRDEGKQRNQINYTLGDSVFECFPWHSYKEREDSIYLGPVRQPCGRRCKCEWGSRTCFEKRGQVYDRVARGWVRDTDGQILIGKKECDWEPR